MNDTQTLLYNFVQRNFDLSAISVVLIGEDKVQVTDRTGEHMTFGMNDRGDVVDTNGKKIYESKNGYAISKTI